MSSGTVKTVVIGAGLAGLTTAYRLNQYGKEVEVYEARPRVGGRVHTVQIKNIDGTFSNGEVGGQNISDGGEAIHILSLIKELKLSLLESDVQFNGVFHDGEHLHHQKQLVSEIVAANPRIYEKIAQLATATHSMQEVVEHLQLSVPQKSYISFVLNAYEGLPLGLLSTNIHNISTLQYILSGGLSAAHARSEENPTLHRISIQGGNTLLPMRLAESLQNRLHFHKVLTQVQHDQNNKIVLIFADGEKVICDILILAIPCSVYKEIRFDPRVIDKVTLDRIQGIPYGTTTKVLMPIKHHSAPGHWVATSSMGAFFNDDQKLLNLYYIQDDGKSIFNPKLHEEYIRLLQAGFEESILNLNPVVEVEDQNNTQYHAPVAKSWFKDPYAQGSYSAFDIFQGNDIEKRMTYQGVQIKALFAPIQDRLFFVGEHATILDEIGTMEAAVESGERIAKILIN